MSARTEAAARLRGALLFGEPPDLDDIETVLAAQDRLDRLVHHYRVVGWVGLAEVVRAQDGPSG